jgi:hypothetical protein
VHLGWLLVENVRTVNRHPNMTRPLTHSMTIRLSLLGHHRPVTAVVNTLGRLWDALPTEDAWVHDAMAVFEQAMGYGH